jgi:hypothetical protein
MSTTGSYATQADDAVENCRRVFQQFNCRGLEEEPLSADAWNDFRIITTGTFESVTTMAGAPVRGVTCRTDRKYFNAFDVLHKVFGMEARMSTAITTELIYNVAHWHPVLYCWTAETDFFISAHDLYYLWIPAIAHEYEDEQGEITIPTVVEMLREVTAILYAAL